MGWPGERRKLVRRSELGSHRRALRRQPGRDRRASVILSGSASVSELSLRNGAALALAAGGDRVLRTASLFLDPRSVLDLRDNELIIDYTGESPAPAVREHLQCGRNGGAWNGYGINSSSAAEVRRPLATPRPPISSARSQRILAAKVLTPTSIIVRHTLLGDANLDGDVDVADLGILATSWQGTNKTFSQGDFNYDGVVDVSDLGSIASNWQKSLPPASTTATELSLPIAKCAAHEAPAE